MFFSASYPAVYFARRTVFTILCRQARFLSVSPVSSTKNFYNESIMFSENQRKSDKATNGNNKVLEQSQLYLNEMENLNNHKLMDEFNWLMDDETPSIMKDPVSDKPKNVVKKLKAVDQASSMQEDPVPAKPRNVVKKLKTVDQTSSMQEDPVPAKPRNVVKKLKAVDQTSSMQEVQTSFQPLSVARKSEEEGLEISETKQIHLKEIFPDEKLSDVDSDSESDSENYAEAEDYSGRKMVSNKSKLDFFNKKIINLKRKSKFFREHMEGKMPHSDGLVVICEVEAIFKLARLGVKPKSLFFTSYQILGYFPANLTDVDLYRVPYEDMKYWAYPVKTRESAAVGLYKKEDMKVKASSLKPEMPLTLIFDQFWNRNSFIEVLNSALITPPKLLISSKECIDPWHGKVVWNSFGKCVFFNHFFGLDWEGIQQKVDENDNVYLLELAQYMDGEGNWTESRRSFPSVDLYNHNFWDRKNITVIVTYNRRNENVRKELYEFCMKRNASRINTGVKKILGPTLFYMVLFELRRQWLTA